MGKHGIASILNLAQLEAYIDNYPPDTLARQFDFAYLAALSAALEETYGPRGGRGIALRIGRATFSQGLKSFGMLAGMEDAAFRVLPLQKRLRLGLDALATVFTRFSDQESRVEHETDHYHFIVSVSPMAWNRTADRPVCHALAGMIQEGLRWASHGFEYHVHETVCRAVSGQPCCFQISQAPIGGGRIG